MLKKSSTPVTRGDHVEWNTPQGTTEGTVIKKLTRTAKARGHTARASTQEPQFEVKSDKSGKTAIHKPESLKKTTRKSSNEKSISERSRVKPGPRKNG